MALIIIYLVVLCFHNLICNQFNAITIPADSSLTDSSWLTDTSSADTSSADRRLTDKSSADRSLADKSSADKSLTEIITPLTVPVAVNGD